MHLHNYFQTIHSALLQNFRRSNWTWKVNGRLQFRKYLIHQVQVQLVSIFRNPESQKQCSIDLIPKKIKNSKFCPFCMASHYENIENPSPKLETEFSSRSMTYPSGRVISHNLQRKFLKLLQFFPENLQHTQKKDEHDEVICGKFYQKILRNEVICGKFCGRSWSKSFNIGTGSLTIYLVSNASPRFFVDNTQSSFTNFLPEQLNLEGQWDVAISEISYPSMYQNVAEGTFMSFNKKLSKLSEFYYLELGFYPSITDFVEATDTLIQERHNHS